MSILEEMTRFYLKIETLPKYTMICLTVGLKYILSKEALGLDLERVQGEFFDRSGVMEDIPITHKSN